MVESAHAPRLKEVYTSVKRFKTGKNMMWRLVGVGSQLVLEGLQRCLAHGSLRELIPKYNGPREKALLVCIAV